MKRVPLCSSKAFTLIELLVVLAMLVALLTTLMPAMTKTNTSVNTFKCLSNTRQLCVAWRMYAEDNRGRLVYSSDDGTGTANPLNQYAWTLTHMDYSSANAGNWDTNADIVLRPLFPYTGRNPAIYKCPSDKSFVIVSGVPRPRVRTMAMNMYVGGFAGTDGGLAPTYSVYTDLNMIQAGGAHSPGPARLWVFMDEREDAINWGNFSVSMAGYSPSNPSLYQFSSDFPGSYHNRAASFSFADGHGEIHRWLDARTTPPLGALSGVSFASPRNLDIAWLQDHSSRLK